MLWLAAVLPSPAESGGPGWIALFNGENLDGWTASENPASFRVSDGAIRCSGPRAHLFYRGDGRLSDLKNFELKLDVLTQPGANSGVYFHTRFQEIGWPDRGFEVQVNNTATGEGGYRELKKTGSLYGFRNLYKSSVNDREWFQMLISVKGKRVQIRLNGVLVVDYVEPATPVILPGYEGRFLSRGTFALQCHDPGSQASFRNIYVKPLPDDLPDDLVVPPVADAAFVNILKLGLDNFPVVDLHGHLKGGLTIAQALEWSRQTGIFYGIAPNCGVGFSITNDAGIHQYLREMRGQPVFLGMQAEGREWVRLFSPEAVARFDYVFSDAMTFTDQTGQRTRLWINDEVRISDKQAFMDYYVAQIQKVLASEPIDIYVNPTFLPEIIASEYDRLWIPSRMGKVIEAAFRSGVAIEINSRYRIPSPAFIKRAHKAGVKFSLGTNNGAADLGRMDYGFEMVRECGLTWQDMFMPKPEGQKPIQVKGFKRLN